VFDFDNGAYGGYGDISNYAIPTPAYLGFSGRTGGATNNQYAICVRLLQTIILRKHRCCCCSWVKDISTSLPSSGSISGRTCQTDEMQAILQTYCPAGQPIPATCPPGCAAIILPWYQSCSQTDQYIAVDRTTNGLLTQFRTLCANPPAPPPPPPPPAPAIIPHEREGSSPVAMGRFITSGSTIITGETIQLVR